MKSEEMLKMNDDLISTLFHLEGISSSPSFPSICLSLIPLSMGSWDEMIQREGMKDRPSSSPSRCD